MGRLAQLSGERPHLLSRCVVLWRQNRIRGLLNLQPREKNGKKKTRRFKEGSWVQPRTGERKRCGKKRYRTGPKRVRLAEERSAERLKLQHKGAGETSIADANRERARSVRLESVDSVGTCLCRQVEAKEKPQDSAEKKTFEGGREHRIRTIEGMSRSKGAGQADQFFPRGRSFWPNWGGAVVKGAEGTKDHIGKRGQGHGCARGSKRSWRPKGKAAVKHRGASPNKANALTQRQICHLGQNHQ